jgi:UDP-N-acetylglucosamine--N-acetylmuramyl-(pentapeptide) pyrophosphoryl-undecaprenol N-acetylglucosamine transferase
VTLAEIETVGLPAILIPYPYAAGNHQMFNARAFAEKGGAIIIENDRLDNVSLLDEAIGLFKSGKISKMKEATASRKNFRTRAATDVVVDEILKLINYEKE